jgi:uncharacterized membrane protein YoaT (DUF817 family)
MDSMIDHARVFTGQLLRFAWLEALSCAYAVALFAGMAAIELLPTAPVAHYDLLLGFGLLLTLAAWATGWERGRNVAAIAGCHLLGLALELVKVRAGSWSYPHPALTKVGGVPLYSGFMYAAVGSFVCASWRLLRLRLSGYRPRLMVLLAAAAYANFLTDRWWPDLRWPIALLLVLATARTTVHFTVGARRYRMPLALSFTLIGFFLWLAENIATALGAWRYPYQLHAWQPVSVAVWSSWALLIVVVFVLVTPGAVRRGAATRYTEPG